MPPSIRRATIAFSTIQSLPMKLSYVSAAGGKQVRGECTLNGGGEVLHLRAASGNIQLRCCR